MLDFLSTGSLPIFDRKFAHVLQEFCPWMSTVFPTRLSFYRKLAHGWVQFSLLGFLSTGSLPVDEYSFPSFYREFAPRWAQFSLLDFLSTGTFPIDEYSFPCKTVFLQGVCPWMSTVFPVRLSFYKESAHRWVQFSLLNFLPTGSLPMDEYSFPCKTVFLQGVCPWMCIVFPIRLSFYRDFPHWWVQFSL